MRVRTLVVSLVFLIACLCERAQSNVTGDVEQLNVAATEECGNRERIRTWRGKVLVTDEVSEEGALARRAKSSAEFAFRADPRTLLWTSTILEDEKLISGKPQPVGGPEFSSGMFTSDASYRLFPLSREKQKDIWTVFVTPRRGNRIGPYSFFAFDPTLFFGPIEPIGERFARVYTTRDDPGWTHVVASRHGEHIVLDMRLDGLTVLYEVDLSHGGNLVSFDSYTDAARDRSFAHWRLHHVKKGGAWVPDRIVLDSMSPEPLRARKREIVWVDNAVNEPLDEHAFSLARMGLRRGDRVTDNRSNTSYTLMGDEVPPRPSDPPPRVGDTGSPALRWHRLVVWSGFAATLLLAVFFWRQARRGTARRMVKP